MSEPLWSYRPVNTYELDRVWNKNISAHPGDERWIRWRNEAFRSHDLGRSQTFCVFKDDEPVGEGTLMFSPECIQIGGRKDLADGRTIANVNGLRIEKNYEGQGRISRLMREIEAFARNRGFTHLSIGVEAAETRNLSIYLHMGYTEFIRHDIEAEILVLYYRKLL